MKEYYFEVAVKKTYLETVDLVTSTLKDEGFGVLTSIDVKATFKNKLDREFRPYTILGACNPPLAFKALRNVPEIGLLLPCNVTIEDAGERGSIVRILDPKIMVNVGDLAENGSLIEVANNAHLKLRRVFEAISN